MYPLHFFDLYGGGDTVSKREDVFKKFEENFYSICNTYHAENRVLCFAFIFYRKRDAHLVDLFANTTFQDALDEISGRYFTIFALKDMKKQSPENIGLTEATESILSHFFSPEEPVQYPTVLFFQVVEKNIPNHFFVPLREVEKEKGFLEIRNILETAEGSLMKINPQFEHNYGETIPVLQRAIEHELKIKPVRNFVESKKSISALISVLKLIIAPS